MTDFIPPKPKPHARKLSPFRRILEVRHSSISVLFDRSYSMHLGDVWTPSRRVYFVNQPDLVNRVLVKDADKFPKSIAMGSMLEFLMGTGVFVSNGELWRKQRRMLDPAFNQARIQDVFPLMRVATEEMAARFRAHADGADLADRRGNDARHRRHHFPHHLFARARPPTSRAGFSAPSAAFRSSPMRRASGGWQACRAGFRRGDSLRAAMRA